MNNLTQIWRLAPLLALAGCASLEHAPPPPSPPPPPAPMHMPAPPPPPLDQVMNPKG